MGKEEERGVRAGAWETEECWDGSCEAYKVEMMMWTDTYLRSNVFVRFE